MFAVGCQHFCIYCDGKCFNVLQRELDSAAINWTILHFADRRDGADLAGLRVNRRHPGGRVEGRRGGEEGRKGEDGDIVG